MTADNWITVVSLLLGSSVLLNILQMVANRFRFDRRADLVRAWKEESLIADEFEDAASKEMVQSNRDRAKTKIAFGHAVRADLNRRIASEIVPAATWAQLTFYLIAVFILIVGIFTVAIAFAPIWNDGVSHVQVAIPGSGFIAVGLFLYWYANSLEVGRATARKMVIGVLNNRPDLRSQIVTFEDGKAKLFATRRGDRFRRMAFGLDVAANVESFLNKTVSQDDLDYSFDHHSTN